MLFCYDDLKSQMSTDLFPSFRECIGKLAADCSNFYETYFILFERCYKKSCKEIV